VLNIITILPTAYIAAFIEGHNKLEYVVIPADIWKRKRFTNPKPRKSFPVEWTEMEMQHNFQLATGTSVRRGIVLKIKFNNVCTIYQ
jgi:hypothetical protein